MRFSSIRGNDGDGAEGSADDATSAERTEPKVTGRCLRERAGARVDADDASLPRDEERTARVERHARALESRLGGEDLLRVGERLHVEGARLAVRDAGERTPFVEDAIRYHGPLKVPRE